METECYSQTSSNHPASVKMNPRRHPKPTVGLSCVAPHVCACQCMCLKATTRNSQVILLTVSCQSKRGKEPFIQSTYLLTKLPSRTHNHSNWSISWFQFLLIHYVNQHGPNKGCSFPTACFSNANHVSTTQCYRHTLDKEKRREGMDTKKSQF